MSPKKVRKEYSIKMMQRKKWRGTVAAKSGNAMRLEKKGPLMVLVRKRHLLLGAFPSHCTASLDLFLFLQAEREVDAVSPMAFVNSNQIFSEIVIASKDGGAAVLLSQYIWTVYLEHVGLPGSVICRTHERTLSEWDRQLSTVWAPTQNGSSQSNFKFRSQCAKTNLVIAAKKRVCIIVLICLQRERGTGQPVISITGFSEVPQREGGVVSESGDVLII